MKASKPRFLKDSLIRVPLGAIATECSAPYSDLLLDLESCLKQIADRSSPGIANAIRDKVMGAEDSFRDAARTHGVRVESVVNGWRLLLQMLRKAGWVPGAGRPEVYTQYPFKDCSDD